MASRTTSSFPNNNNASNNEIISSFRGKANYMKAWNPASPPSNRDRLELYALHKQAVSGDAPKNVPSSSLTTGPEKAKYSAWRSKSGLSQPEAMRLYLQESDRQLRVYGTKQPISTTTTTTTATRNEIGGVNGNNNTNTNVGIALQQQQQQQQQQRGQQVQGTSHQQGQSPPPPTRGLAAIPLLCAAASESRVAYLRRLANTKIEHAWWARQEPLCAQPRTIWSFPESTLLMIAVLVERISLLCKGEGMTTTTTKTTTTAAAAAAATGTTGAAATTAAAAGVHPASTSAFKPFIPPTCIQSFLWPVHNSLLSLWMGTIVILTAYTCVLEYIQTIVFGARTTGKTLQSIQEKVELSSDSIKTMCEVHQPLSARLVGLGLLPYTTLSNFLFTVQALFHGGATAGSTATDTTNSNGNRTNTNNNNFPLLLFAGLYIVFVSFFTWWYWLLVCPWLASCLLGLAVMSGNCFALIDLAGV